MVVSLLLYLLVRWTAQELSLVYGELLGGAGLPTITVMGFQYGHWTFLGHAFVMVLSWVALYRRKYHAQLPHFLLLGFAGTQVGLIVVVWIGNVLPLFTITWHLGPPG